MWQVHLTAAVHMTLNSTGTPRRNYLYPGMSIITLPWAPPSWTLGGHELPPQLLLAAEPVGPVQHHSLHLGCEEEELLQEEQAPPRPTRLSKMFLQIGLKQFKYTIGKR